MRSIKEPLRKTLGRALLTLEELSTILTEIESVINNRPITYDSGELDEPRALTPSHFLLPEHRNTGFVQEYFLDLFVSASDRVTLSRRKLFQTKLLKQLWAQNCAHSCQAQNCAHSCHPYTTLVPFIYHIEPDLALALFRAAIEERLSVYMLIVVFVWAAQEAALWMAASSDWKYDWKT
ncbi:hypothetical protein AVEN_23420-1 [Araneus ventricosus]|uniref:Uncharacterized protein n=1 Tax=Araneus ventricosus TaxID=182803 RepID=A0A4Y2E7Y6_ARAVE|nr:hypothetical protein AVEN_23420-1 [Araneus ventricosus]